MSQQLNKQGPLLLSDEWRDSGYILTYTGKRYYPDRPEELDVDIMDIAHALSNVCRYNGHLLDHYSVGHHSLIVSELVPREMALEGLMHDACEAYLPDMPSAVKAVLPEFVEYQERINAHVFKCLGLNYPFGYEINWVDKVIRQNEMYYLGPEVWNTPPPTAISYRVEAEIPKITKAKFLARYNELYNLRFNS